MIFMHIYALFAQNRRCPLTGWRKHAHPSLPPSSPFLESGYPKSALKIFSRASRAEPSRAEPHARVTSATYFFFFPSLSPHSTLFPRCPSRVAHPSLSMARPADRLALSLFSREREGGRGYRQKRDQTDDGDKKRKILSSLLPPRSLVDDESGRFAQRWTRSERLARAQTRFVVCVYVCVYVCVCVLYRNATRTWPKAGISLISFPAALPAEVAIKIVWKGGRYAYNEYPGVLRFSCGGEREGGIRSGRKGVACHAVVFCGFLELGKEGGIMRRGRWELTGVNSWMGEEEEEEKDRFSKGS